MTKEQWKAIQNNDKNYDGKFFYALKTTKNVCRPSCPARACNPKNVLIFNTYEEAAERGFRPCLRCRPDQPEWQGAGAELADAAKAYIDSHYTGKFSLNDISGYLYVNGSYLLRVFKAATGMTLLQYHNYVRCTEAQKLLEDPELSISIIAFRVGFSSSSHFTRVFKNIVGITPSAYREDYIEELTR